MLPDSATEWPSRRVARPSWQRSARAQMAFLLLTNGLPRARGAAPAVGARVPKRSRGGLRLGAQVDALRCVSRGKRRERRGCQDPWQGRSPCEVAEDFTVCRLSSDCESEGRRGPQTPSRGNTSVGGDSGTLLLSFPRKSGCRLMPHRDLTPSRQGDVVSSPIRARRRRRNAMPRDVSRGALHVAFMTVSRYNCSVLLLATIHL